ncbi:MAG: LacI family DNA-binding transcriptional regulator [Deltaproteobacteria bacterium]|nr:LacI family DNA-binding transcriptional regulator [Deltaproteobacteria bacterium]MBW2726393.1 LacI family DNA-binding transcriptional regulator [Deltaproteobacteria bacterium]
MTTLRDVAKRARVSIKTASRVVNDEAGVAPETLARVRRAVRTLAYVPNVSARRLVRRRAHVLGLVYQNQSWNWINDFQRGAIAEAHRLGYEILMHPWDLEHAGEEDALLRAIDQGSVDGLILTPPCGDAESLIQALERRGAAYASIAPTTREGTAPTVSASDHDGAFEMGSYLIEQGHRRLAFVAGGPEQRSSHDRESGFRAALEAGGVAWDPELYFQGDFSFTSGVACAHALLDTDPRPTAVFASNDDMAAGILVVCHERGVAVPAELSVSGFDDVALARQVWPALTTIHQPTDEIAALATRLLVESLDESSPSDRHRTLATRLIVRDSTGPPCS